MPARLGGVPITSSPERLVVGERAGEPIQRFVGDRPVDAEVGSVVHGECRERSSTAACGSPDWNARTARLAHAAVSVGSVSIAASRPRASCLHVALVEGEDAGEAQQLGVVRLDGEPRLDVRGSEIETSDFLMDARQC